MQFGDPDNRVAVLRVVKSIGPAHTTTAIAAVTEALAHQDLRVRRAAAETLATYGSRARNDATLAALRVALSDSDQGVRIGASEAMRRVLEPGRK